MLCKQSFLEGSGVAPEEEAFKYSLEESGLDFDRQRLRSGKEKRREGRGFLEQKNSLSKGQGSYIICRVQCKTKMQNLLLKNRKKKASLKLPKCKTSHFLLWFLSLDLVWCFLFAF